MGCARTTVRSVDEFLAVVAPRIVWDEERWHTIAARQLQYCREAGLLAQLVISVNAIAVLTVWRGDFAAAAPLVAEGEAIAEATGTRFAPFSSVLLAGFQGAKAEAAPLIEAMNTAARAAGQGAGIQWSQWVAAVLYNGLGRYETALAEAQQASEQTPELQVSMRALQYHLAKVFTKLEITSRRQLWQTVPGSGRDGPTA